MFSSRSNERSGFLSKVERGLAMHFKWIQFAHLLSIRVSSRLQDTVWQDYPSIPGNFFRKSLQSNWLVAWHQDATLPIKERRDALYWGPWSVKEGIICARAPASALEQILAIRVSSRRFGFGERTAEGAP